MEHYFSDKPKSRKKDSIISCTINSMGFKFHTSSSVFSKNHIDKGTELLIKKCSIHGKKILDIGCGYGPIGIVLKKLYPEAEIIMTDINERALELAKKNAKENNVEADVIKSDLYKNIDGKFDGKKLKLDTPKNSVETIKVYFR